MQPGMSLHGIQVLHHANESTSGIPNGSQLGHDYDEIPKRTLDKQQKSNVYSTASATAVKYTYHKWHYNITTTNKSNTFWLKFINRYKCNTTKWWC